MGYMIYKFQHVFSSQRIIDKASQLSQKEAYIDKYRKYNYADKYKIIQKCGCKRCQHVPFRPVMAKA
jgi:hypothetical protein